jgi:hypothetical protein
LQPNVFRLDGLGPGLVEDPVAHDTVTDRHTLGKNVEEVGVEAKIVSTSHHTRVVGRRRLLLAAQALP